MINSQQIISVLGYHKTGRKYGSPRLALSKQLYHLAMKFLGIHRKTVKSDDMLNSLWRETPVFCTATGRRLNGLGNIITSKAHKVCFE